MPSRKRKVVGLFRPITRKELKGYSRTLSNPLGVTTIATVNGRGRRSSARSARSVARTESPAARLRRAKQLLKGASSMRLLRTHRGFRRNARAKTTAEERQLKSSKAYKEVKAQAARDAAAAAAAAKAAKRAKAQVRLDRIKLMQAKRAEKKAARKAKAAAHYAKKRDKKIASWGPMVKEIPYTRMKRVQVRFGPYRRAKRLDARTSKSRLSFLYAKRVGGKLQGYKKIPKSAIVRYSMKTKKGPVWTKERIDTLREKAASRVKARGGTWVPNRKGEGKIRPGSHQHGYRLALFKSFVRKGLSKNLAAQRTLKKYPLAQGQIFAGYVRSGNDYFACSTRTHRPKSKKKGSSVYMRRHASFTPNRRSRRRLRVARRTHLHMNPLKLAFRANRKRRVSRKSTARRSTARRRILALRGLVPRRRRKSRRGGARRRRLTMRAMVPNRRRRRHHRRAHLTMNGRRHRRGHRRFTMNRRHRRGYRRNGFMADLLQVLKTGAIVGAGFLTHRLLSNLLVDFLLIKKDGTGMIDKMQDVGTDGKPNSIKKYLKIFAKPLSGLVVVAAGIPLAQAVIPSKRVEVGAGMVASLIQQILIAGFTAAGDPTKPDDSMLLAAREISGYESSLAYGLHGKESIMPRFTPVGEYFTPMNGMGEYFTPMSGLGAFTQAAAGMGAFQQAAAGFSQAAAGYNNIGEYFAPASLQGIGQYEGAGEQALLPSANPQVIDDGLRPDGDLDSILDLAESAAGLHGRRGMGEFFAAKQSAGGGFSEKTVPMRSQWIPNGPLWAGTLEVDGSHATSEVPAGILASGGGNGILSG